MYFLRMLKTFRTTFFAEILRSERCKSWNPIGKQCGGKTWNRYPQKENIWKRKAHKRNSQKCAKHVDFEKKLEHLENVFFRRNAPAGGDWGDDSPSAPRRHWPETSFLEKIWKSGWTKRSLILFCPALMQLGRENLCAAKNTGDGRKERYDKEKSVDYSFFIFLVLQIERSKM